MCHFPSRRRRSWLSSDTFSFFYLWIAMPSWSGIVCSCVVHSLEFRIFILLDHLPNKDRKASLPCYLTKKRNWFMPFSKALLRRWSQQTRSEFELGSLILPSVPITLPLSTFAQEGRSVLKISSYYSDFTWARTPTTTQLSQSINRLVFVFIQQILSFVYYIKQIFFRKRLLWNLSF